MFKVLAIKETRIFSFFQRGRGEKHTNKKENEIDY